MQGYQSWQTISGSWACKDTAGKCSEGLVPYELKHGAPRRE